MISAAVVIKLLINATVAIAFAVKGRYDMALMFIGFAVADAGAFWIALR